MASNLKNEAHQGVMLGCQILQKIEQLIFNQAEHKQFTKNGYAVNNCISYIYIE